MDKFDQQLNLLSRQVELIKRSSFNRQPFLINGFNSQFDESLKELVLEYGFDFDQIALHLYYEFPQYEQRINYKTVTFRWWQITVGERVKKRKNQERKIEKQNKQQKGIDINNDEEIQDKVEFFDNSLFPFLEKPLENTSLSTICTQSYSKAMQQSQILTQEQSQRFILYKPKFIVDTEYQLQRYQVQEGYLSAEQKGNDLSQLVIEKLLKKVVSNDFEYDEFGGFEVGEREKRGGGNGKSGKKWWEQQDQEESEYEDEQQFEGRQQRDYKENQGQKGAGAIQIKSANLINEQGPQKQLKSPNHHKKPQTKSYDLDQDWDEYESD